MLESLGKKEVAAAIKDAPADIAEVLSLRLMLAKSSVKKYQAMENSVCEDDRCHGMFSFYGANRTGRWSGRLIQLQNLYRNSTPDLEAVRDLVKMGDYEMLDMLYDNVPQVLSELVRTAFIPRPGYKFIVADFSAIEARVIAHLAGEKWVSDTFKANGDIYCETASRMFGVPVEKHGRNPELRQKGKQAVFSCSYGGSVGPAPGGLVAEIESAHRGLLVESGQNGKTGCPTARPFAGRRCGVLLEVRDALHKASIWKASCLREATDGS